MKFNAKTYKQKHLVYQEGESVDLDLFALAKIFTDQIFWTIKGKISGQDCDVESPLSKFDYFDTKENSDDS